MGLKSIVWVFEALFLLGVILMMIPFALVEGEIIAKTAKRRQDEA